MSLDFKHVVTVIIVIIGYTVLPGCAGNDESCLNNTDCWLQAPDSVLNPSSRYIAVIGDIQEYTPNEKTASYLYKTCDWLRSMQHYFGNIDAVLQNGDLTWNNGKKPWQIADRAVSHLGSDLLFIPVTGNHDYTWNSLDDVRIADRGSSLFNSMPNITRLRNEHIECFEEGKMDNIVVPLKGAMDTWNVIGLEFGPRKDAVEWADSIVRANPDKKYILMTHEWLTRSGVRINLGSSASQQFEGQSYSTPQEIWEKMVYPNDNIVCVVCGHNGFCKYLFSPNNKGRDVCQILFNLQYQENGGDGMVQLWEFPDNKKEINIFVYNTIKREIHPDSSTKVKIEL